MNSLTLEFLPGEFAIARYRPGTMPDIDWTIPYQFLAKTPGEISLVGRQGSMPAGYGRIERGWTAFRVAGVLDFSLVGILYQISSLLSDQGISLFCVSTFDTDYILVKSDQRERARQALAAVFIITDLDTDE